jgi:ABC-type Fe3+ transport system substrate-binding protein
MRAGRIFAIVGLAMAANPPFGGNAHAADQALIDAAKQEGELNWYTTQIITQFARPAADAFQKKYGIKVNAIRGGSVELAVKLLNEHKAGRMQADVFDGTSTTATVKQAGVAMKWVPDAAKQLPKEFTDTEGYWIGTNVFVHTPAFNTTLVLRGTEPTTWQDLLDPKWKGKMAWTAHATTSGAPGFIGVVLRELGEEKGMAYLRALAKQNIIQVGGSARTVTDQAIAGEYPIALQIFNHQPLISSQQGAPIDWIPISPAMEILSVTSVAAGARHPNAAKLLVDFLVSDDGQKLFRDLDYITVAPSIPPREPKLRPDGTRFRAMFFTPEAVEAAMPRWMQVFNDTFR